MSIAPTSDSIAIILLSLTLYAVCWPLTDTYHPAWVAELDGTEMPIYRADHLFRAVAVPAGDHTLTMEFRPYRHGVRWLAGKLADTVE